MKEKTNLVRCLRQEGGQALIIVLVLLLLGSFTLPPLLSYMSTSLKTGQVYQSKTNELYAADSGIEDGLWRIKYDYLGPTYDIYDFTTNWTYPTDPVNGQSANVTIQNVWIPSNVTLDRPWLERCSGQKHHRFREAGGVRHRRRCPR